MSFSPAPLAVEEVLDAGWLGAALSRDRGPVEVAGFTVVETLGPSALKIRLQLDFTSPPPADIPAEICIKGIFDPKLSTWLVSGAQRTESYFYERLAPDLSVRVPRALYAGFDPETMNGVVVMEDLVPLGARFLSAMSPYTRAQAHGSLDQLARLHGATWNRPASRDPWVDSKLAYLAGGPSVSSGRLTELMRGERGDALPDAVRSGPRIYGAITALAAQVEAGGDQCYIHGDCHAGNVWEAADGGAGLVDWQVLQRGFWALDVAYHVAAVLDVEDRRTHERDLLTYYLERLGAHGGTPPAFDDAWSHYGAAMAYGLLMWGMTQRVEPAIVHRFVTRLGTAVADHESFEALGV